VLSLFFIDRVASYRDYDAAGISRCAHLLAPVPRRAFPMAAAPCAHTSRVCTPTSLCHRPQSRRECGRECSTSCDTGDR
jgi:hypothetical protein